MPLFKYLFVIFFAGLFSVSVFANPLQLTDIINALPKSSESPAKLNQPLNGNIIYLISIEGLNTIPSENVLDVLSIKTGDKLNPFFIDFNIKNIQSLGTFSNVSSYVTKNEKGAHLTFRVTENVTVGDVKINGNHIFHSEELYALLETKPKQL